LTCNDVDNIRSKRLTDVFSQTIPKNVLAKHVKFVKGDGCLFGQYQPASFDRVNRFFYYFVSLYDTTIGSCRCTMHK